jgi:plasmid rolling circle replication initiator protein Rep
MNPNKSQIVPQEILTDFRSDAPYIDITPVRRRGGSCVDITSIMWPDGTYVDGVPAVLMDGAYVRVMRDLRPDGTERPWRKKKLRGYAVVDSYCRLGMLDKAAKLVNCCTWFVYKRNPLTGEMRLYQVNLCRDRLCPICSWRRSLRLSADLSSVISVVDEDYRNLKPLMLTLTVRNCAAEAGELSAVIDRMMKAWDRFLKSRKIKGIVKGWFRTLEITYNKETGEFHPHFHVLLYVDRSYMRGSEDWMETSEWVQRWKSALRFDYDPVCDVRHVRVGKDGTYREGALELAKYVVKDTDYIIDGDEKLTDKLVLGLSVALKRRRLSSYGGILKRIAAEFVKDEEDADLIHIDDDLVTGDGFTELVVYRWDYGRREHLFDRCIKLRPSRGCWIDDTC